MAGLESEPLIEAMRVRPALVGIELDQIATPAPTFGDGPFEHGRPDAGAALCAVHPHRFDLAAPGAAPRDAGDEGDLETADDYARLLDGHQHLVGIPLDRREGVDVALIQRQPRIIPRL